MLNGTGFLRNSLLLIKLDGTTVGVKCSPNKCKPPKKSTHSLPPLTPLLQFSSAQGGSLGASLGHALNAAIVLECGEDNDEGEEYDAPRFIFLWDW